MRSLDGFGNPLLRALVCALLVPAGLVLLDGSPVQAAVSVTPGFSGEWNGAGQGISHAYSYGIMYSGGGSTQGGTQDCQASTAEYTSTLQGAWNAISARGDTLATWWYLTGPDYPGVVCSESYTPYSWGQLQAEWYYATLSAALPSIADDAHAFADVEMAGTDWSSNKSDNATEIAEFEGELQSLGVQNRGIYSDPGEWGGIISGDPALNTGTIWMGDNQATTPGEVSQAEQTWTTNGYSIWSWQAMLAEGSCPNESLSFNQTLAALATPEIPRMDAYTMSYVGTVCTTDVGIASGIDDSGYWGVDVNGGVYRLGDAPDEGQVPTYPPPAAQTDIVGMAAPSAYVNGAYWVAGADGNVWAFGAAGNKGNCTPSGDHCNQTIVGIAPYASCGSSGCTANGYWLVSSLGGVYTFGSAKFDGSCQQAGSGCQNVSDIVGMATTPDEGGYWLVGADGGVFTFGDAKYENSCAPGGDNCGETIKGIAADPASSGDNGYWLVGQSGGVYTFGTATYHGSEGGTVNDMVGMTADPDGGGYWERASTGQVWAYGSAVNEGDFGF